MSAHARLFTPEQQQLAERVCAVAEDAYYEILQVQEEAHEDELALQLHPDKNAAPRAEDAFKLVAEAWAVLGNPRKRAAYDEQRRRGFQRNPFDGLHASDKDDFPDDDPPPLNETRKQRRKREFEARRRARERARQEEWAHRQAVNIEELLDVLGVEIHYCANCGTLHLHMRDEQGPCIHPTPTSPPQQSWSRPAATTRMLSLDFVMQLSPVARITLLAVVLTEALPVILPIIWKSWWSTIAAAAVTLFVGARFVPLPHYVQEQLQGLRRQIQQSWRRVIGGERVALQRPTS
ncbi:DnaJ-domain-containing protein [Exidia glandulosa HHB12029]|uniref:DnaJ-domain-containing protein n=1 Tax=Exidia glandulosa HHB12029 TaxID=1314781 RepID=A0A165DH16_EXIGL|nr:DnaJ-domain-containing protein [Exidia glandulosa HHB12029]